MTAGENLAAVVGAQLAAGELGHVRHATMLPPACNDAAGDPAWLDRTAEPTEPPPAARYAAAHPGVEGLSRMSWGQLRDAVIAEHSARQLAELQLRGARSELKVTTDAHTITLDECVALRQSLRAAEAVIADLRAKVAERDALVTSLSTRGRVTSYWAILGDGVTVHAYACFGVSLWLAYSVGTGGSVGSGSNPREAVESLARNLGLTGALVASVVEVTHALDINDAVVDAIDGARAGDVS